jgi:hypothetical protein
VSNTITRLFYDKDYLIEILEMTYSNNLALIEKIILIFGNLIVDNYQFIILNTKFLQRLTELLTDENFLLRSKDKLEYNIPIIIVWCFNVIFNEIGDDKILEFSYLIPYFMNFFNPNYLYEKNITDKNQDELNQVLNLFKLLSTHERIIKSLVTNDLLAQIIYILQYVNIPFSKKFQYDPNYLITLYPQNLIIIMKILNNLYSSKDFETINYMNEKYPSVLEIFENILARYRFFQEDDVETVNEIIWTLCNIVLQSSNNAVLITQTKIPQFLLSYYLKNEKISFQILVFFENCLNNGNIVSALSILKLNFLQTLSNSFKAINKPEAIVCCLNSIRDIIKFSNTIINNLNQYPNMLRIIKLEFENNGIATRLEQLCLHNNTQIANYSKNLLEVLENMLRD